MPSHQPDAQAVDQVLHLFPQPVAVIGAVREGELGGLTAAWVTRVSVNPALIMVAVGHERHTWHLLETAACFSVSLLGEDQIPVGRLFGRHSRRDRDKWAEVDHILLGDGVPALAKCCARLLCEIEGRFTAGDHDCIVGRVSMAEVVDGPPALLMRGVDWIPGDDD
ncbi:hypothetical protein DRQ50_07090 [bacterium]|nr:MAG: hypothetical protein DRQ50_07090 [bacterium]